MAGAYWKTLATRVARGLGPKTLSRLGVSTRLLARAGAVVGAGFLAYELLKSYKENIENEPAYQEMTILQRELEKWGSAISSIGRQPYAGEEFGSLDEGGAINALSPKKLRADDAIKPPDPGTAAELIERAEGYIMETENVFEDADFEEKRANLVARLEQLRKKIPSTDEYGLIQEKLGQIVAKIKPIEAASSSRIYDCSREIQKNQGSNVAWAALSMVTLGFVKKGKPMPSS